MSQHLFHPVCPISIWHVWQGTIHSFQLSLVPQNKPQDSRHLPPGWSNSPISPSNTNKEICTRVPSLRVWITTRQIYKSSVIETSIYRWAFKILQIKNHAVHEFPNPCPEAQSAKGVFQMQYPICAVKGYLCYKTITSQDVSFKARVNFFLFRRKVMFCSQDIQAFVFSTMPWFTS